MPINSLQFRKQKFSSELTDQNSLAQALLTKPEISRTLAYAFGDKYHLNYLTMGSGRVSERYELVGNEEVMWPLQGQLVKSVQVTGTSSPAPANSPGLNFTAFTVPLEDKYFALGDTVKFPSGTLARVQSEPTQQGDKWLYTLVIVSHDATDFIEAADLVIGVNLGFAFPAFEEYSKGGSSKKATPMWFRNQMTTSRYKWSMSGGSRTDVMVLEFKGEGGKRSALWMYQEEYQAMLQWNRITEIQRWYSRFNRTSNGTVEIPGQNGRPVKYGGGLIQQLEGTNFREYTTLDEDFIRDFLLDLQIQSKESENSQYMAFTGASGLSDFDKAMKDSRQQFNLVDTHFVSKHGSGLKFGDNFVTYKGLMGTTITLVHVPLFDDKTLHTDIDPDTNLPFESGRFVICDMGDYDGESNISLCAKGADGIDRSFLRWCNDGAVTFEGSNMKSLMRSSDIDGFEVNYLSETLLKVINPLSCGMLVKSRVQ